MSRADLLLVAGARPNFVKLAPLHKAIATRTKLTSVIVHTGQHYDDAMSASFFRELGIPAPDVNLEVGPGTHAVQTGTIMQRLEPVLLNHRPRWVIVFGDVNSTVACALVAAKLGTRVAHVEAGLRSFDWTMPEEINRVLTDRLADRLYAPSHDACENLAREGIPAERVLLVGNIMVDTLRAQLPQLDQGAILRESDVEARKYVLVTLHRPSNVDDPAALERICSLLRQAAEREAVLFPAHPRTRKRLSEVGGGEALGRVRVLDPLPYGTFLGLMANARVVVTDSGGVQEETTALGVPCLTLRPNTERPITVTEGTNQLVDSDAAFLRGLQSANGRRHRIPKLWDGHTAERIAQDLVRLAAA